VQDILDFLLYSSFSMDSDHIEQWFAQHGEVKIKQQLEMQKLTVILPFPTPCKALIGCQSAENVIPMLNKCTVLPAIHIIKPIISKFLKGACATSQAFCSNGKRFSTLEQAMK
jgi:hypothetical protein